MLFRLHIRRLRLPDICRGLADLGHEVRVITGVPNYPMGVIYDGYKQGHTEEIIDGIRVSRTYTFPRGKSSLGRLINYYSFPSSSSRLAKRIEEDYDVVLVNQLSPVLMAKAAIAYKRKHGTPVLLYCLDLWPESLSAGNVSSRSLLYKWFLGESRRIYKAVDRIAVSSLGFRGYFAEKFGIEVEDYLPQYAESLFEGELPPREDDGRVNLMFAGNVGSAQSVQTIIRAAKLTEDTPELLYHVVGDGSSLAEVKALAEELCVQNVVFHKRVSVDRMPEYYAMADAMLLTMKRAPVFALTLPGKVQSYMAAGKPILAAADGECTRVVEEAGCGFCCPSEDAEGLADLARRFAASKEKRAMGERAREYSRAHFTREGFLESLEALLYQTCGKR